MTGGPAGTLGVMATTYQIAEIASHLGEPPRAAMLTALMDGRALTATELAGVAGITPQTASSHLARLTGARLLRVDRQGRHRYHRLATAEVARMLEGVMQLAATRHGAQTAPLVVGPRDAALRLARTCYDHLAGQLGVALAEALLRMGAIELDEDGGVVTEHGIMFLRRTGIDLAAEGKRAGRSSRPACRPCLDWSERRFHIAGKLGAALCRHWLAQCWVRRLEDTRALEITAEGRLVLREVFKIERLA